MEQALFEAVLKKAAQKAIDNSTQLDKSSITTLNVEEESLLAEKILLLPEKYNTILFLRYVYHHTEDEVSFLMDDINISAKCIYAKKILVNAMGFSNTSEFSEESFVRASKIALECFYEKNKDVVSIEPAYSKKFYQKLKKLKPPSPRPNLILVITKRIAVVCAAFILVFTATLTVNAELRERFFKWVVEALPTFSNFYTVDSDKTFTKENEELIKEYNVNYIPAGFELSNTTESVGHMMYSYLNDKEEWIAFIIDIPGSPHGLDTENAVITEFEMHGNKAFSWERDGISYIVWTIDGFECYLFGQISMEDALEMAKSIQKNKIKKMSPFRLLDCYVYPNCQIK